MVKVVWLDAAMLGRDDVGECTAKHSERPKLIDPAQVD